MLDVGPQPINKRTAVKRDKQSLLEMYGICLEFGQIFCYFGLDV